MYAKFQFLITFTDRKKNSIKLFIEKMLSLFCFLSYNYLKLFAKMICVWFRIWIVNSLQLWHICIHKYRFCDVWGSCELYFKESFMVKVLGHLFQQQTFITHFFLFHLGRSWQNRHVYICMSPCHIILLSVGFFFYADVGVS